MNETLVIIPRLCQLLANHHLHSYVLSLLIILEYLLCCRKLEGSSKFTFLFRASATYIQNKLQPSWVVPLQCFSSSQTRRFLQSKGLSCHVHLQQERNNKRESTSLHVQNCGGAMGRGEDDQLRVLSYFNIHRIRQEALWKKPSLVVNPMRESHITILVTEQVLMACAHTLKQACAVQISPNSAVSYYYNLDNNIQRYNKLE